MQQTTDEVIRKIGIELEELTGRINSMERFFICEDFQEISIQQRDLLAEQHNSMCQYKSILIKRIFNLRKEKRDGTQSN